MFKTPIQIHGLFVAAEHRIFNKKGIAAGYDNLIELEKADLVANCGIVGDRFFADRPEFNGHVTFFSYEVYQELVKAMGEINLGPEAARRNIIVSGVDLKLLYGKTFRIGEVEFEGTIHCAPCKGIDAIYGQGALETLKGRGGLRARVHSTGRLEKGGATLVAEFPTENGRPSEMDRLPKIP